MGLMVGVDVGWGSGEWVGGWVGGGLQVHAAMAASAEWLRQGAARQAVGGAVQRAGRYGVLTGSTGEEEQDRGSRGTQGGQGQGH